MGPPPAQSLVGGVYQYGLLSRSGPGGVSLVLTWRLRDPEATQQKGKSGGGARARQSATAARARQNETAAHARQNETAEGKEVVLVDRLVNAEFSYFGGGDRGSQAALA